MGIRIWGLIIIVVALGALFVWIYGRILIKVGYSRWLSLLLLVPVVNLILIWVFAFARWPSLDKKTSP